MKFYKYVSCLYIEIIFFFKYRETYTHYDIYYQATSGKLI